MLHNKPTNSTYNVHRLSIIYSSSLLTSVCLYQLIPSSKFCFPKELRWIFYFKLRVAVFLLLDIVLEGRYLIKIKFLIIAIWFILLCMSNNEKFLFAIYIKISNKNNIVVHHFIFKIIKCKKQSINSFNASISLK